MTDRVQDSPSSRAEAETGRTEWVAPSIMRMQAGAAELAIGPTNDGVGDFS